MTKTTYFAEDPSFLLGEKNLYFICIFFIAKLGVGGGSNFNI